MAIVLVISESLAAVVTSQKGKNVLFDGNKKIAIVNEFREL